VTLAEMDREIGVLKTRYEDLSKDSTGARDAEHHAERQRRAP